LLPVIQELDRRGWRTKRWTTRDGRQRGGRPFSTTSLHKLLTNVTYVGKTRYKHEIHAGEHEAIVDLDTWQRVQALLQRNGRGGSAAVRNQSWALLKGLLRCTPCNCAMTPSFTAKRGRQYRYYQCCAAAKRGRATCPSKAVPAAQIDQFVIDQIRCIGKDPAVLQETLNQARQQDQLRLAALEAERHGLQRVLARWHAELRQCAGHLSRAPDGNTAIVADLAGLQERIAQAEQRLAAVRDQGQVIRQQVLDPEDVARALSQFDPVWMALTLSEQAQMLRVLVARVDYDGARGKVLITFQPAGIQTLTDQLARPRKEKRA
jgi:site-specific DNA recombinase